MSPMQQVASAGASAPAPITTDRPGDGRDYKAAVYGSLLVTTLLAVEQRAIGGAALVVFTLVLSLAVFWLTHTWSALVDVRIRGPVGRAAVLAVAADEAPMLAPAIVPSVVIVLVQVAGGDVDTAIALGLVASLVQLFLWGLAVGRAAHGSWAASAAVATVDLFLGIVLVGLKVIVLH
jgi:hypothetical protein